MLPTTEFFDAFAAAGFLKEASWTPTVGMPGAGVEQKVMGRYRAPSVDVLGADAFATDHTFQYPAGLLPGIVRGQVLTIEGQDYKLREDPRSELDGSRFVLVLEK